MDYPTRKEGESSTVGAAVRVAVSFVVFFLTFAIIGAVIARVPAPDFLANLPGQIAALCGVGAVVFVSARAFDVSPAAYGLQMDRRWISDLLGGAAIGVLCPPYYVPSRLDRLHGLNTGTDYLQIGYLYFVENQWQ